MSEPKLVGIHGPLNGGKDTAANYLHAKYPDKFGRYAFAQPIKQAAQVMFGFTKEQLEDRVLKETVDPFWEFTPRKAMQLLGTEYGRDMLRKDLWIKRAELEHKKNVKIGRGTITVGTEKNDRVIGLLPTTNVTINGKESKIADLKIGDRVQLTLSVDETGAVFIAAGSKKADGEKVKPNQENE